MHRRDVATAALAAVLSGVTLAQSIGEARGTAATAAALAGTAAIGLGARRGLLVAVVVSGSVAAQAVLHTGDPVFGSFLAMMAALFLLARHRGWVALAGGAMAAGIAVGAVVARDPRPFSAVELVFPLAYFGASTVAGRLVRGRERHAEALLAAAEGEAAARERAALAEERARIARDMHDVVAHSVSLLVVQAESAAAVLPRDPQRAAAQVERIADTGREALDELRRLLGLLRVPDESPDRAAQPDLSELPRLAESVRSTGRVVRLDVGPGLEGVPPGLQLAAYRVVQESLTNAVRHGAARELAVDVRRAGASLHVEVVDDGTGGEEQAGGHGLAGMRERLRAYGGRLDAGPAPTGGWRVVATAPLELA